MTNPQNKFNYPKIKRILSNDPIVIYYTLSNNFFYTQLAFAFVPLRDSCYEFFLFVLQKGFDIFRVLLFGVFLYVFGDICHLYR